MASRLKGFLKLFVFAVGCILVLLNIQQGILFLRARRETLISAIHAGNQHLKSRWRDSDISSGAHSFLEVSSKLPVASAKDGADVAQAEVDKTSQKVITSVSLAEARPGIKAAQKAQACSFEGPSAGFLGGCVQDCKAFQNLALAQEACLQDRDCTGFTATKGASVFQLRAGADVQESPGDREHSWVKVCPESFAAKDVPPPAEWQPTPEAAADLDSIGSFVDGHPTIFIGLASYRDDLCRHTIAQALERAVHPSRIFFGVVDQIIDGAGDVPCDKALSSCLPGSQELICIHAHQIRMHRVDARLAQGPTWGRYRADRLYRGEYFALQLDAHMFFVRNWDEVIVKQWNATGNDYAVITTYPSEVTGAMTEKGDALHSSTPLLCSSHFVGKMIKHNPAGEIAPNRQIVGNSPVLETLWAAGISFSRGHRIMRVPYDCCLGMMFDGEEISMAVRMWTHGYDFYSPRSPFVFHPYNRKSKPKLFWENGNRHRGAADLAENRVLALVGADPRGEYDKTELDGKYGLGHRRDVATFLRLFGYDFKHRAARGSCNWVYSQQMHRELVPSLRKDRKGIDYSLVDVDGLLQKYFPGGTESEEGLDGQTRSMRAAERARAKSDPSAYR